MIFKNIRHFYWLLSAFTKKNSKFLLISFVSGFFLILFAINFFPVLNSILFKKSEIIGIVGTYRYSEVPDDILSLISNPLFSVNSKGEIVPVLAQRWQSINNGKTYRIYLKKNLLWNDGLNFTTKDIVYKLKDAKLSPVNDYILDFKLSQSLVIFPNYLTKPVVKYPLKGISGQYKIKHIKLKSNYLTQISLIPNKPDLPYKIFKFYPNEDAMINGYKKGEINTFITNNKSVADYFSTWKNSSVIKENNYKDIMVLFINTKNTLLESKEIRKSIAYSLPSFNDYGQKAFGPIQPSSWAYDSNLKTYTYNLEKAKNMLIKNISSSDSATLSLSTFFNSASIADIIKENLENTGFKISIKLVPDVPENFDLLLGIWTPPTDPDQYIYWHSTEKTTNITKIDNIKIDKLLEDGRRSINPKTRKGIYQQFQQALIDESPAVFLYYPLKYNIKRI